MRARTIGVLALAALLATGRGQAADSYGLIGEQLVTTQATVIDIACDLTGDCPPRCADGRRQLGLRLADGKVLLVGKNVVNFMGGTVDLLPFCGRAVSVDGLTVTNHGATLFMLQRYRASEAEPWQDADRSMAEWLRGNTLPAGSEPGETWMRADPRVKAAVARRGRAGVPE